MRYILLFVALTQLAHASTYETVTMPDGRVMKCVTTPTGTFCY